MPYDSSTDFVDAGALVPEEVSNRMLGKAVEQSAVLSLFTRIPVTSRQVRFPILSALPTAYFVNGDTGLKQTTSAAWSNKYLDVEEIAVIVPFPDNVLADVKVGLWGQVEPLVSEAIARTLDAAVFFGTNAPATWPTNLVAAIAAANTDVTEGSLAAAGGFMNDIDNLHAVVEASGFEVNGWAGPVSLKSKLRAARSSVGERLDKDRVSGDLRTIDGFPVAYPMKGLWPVATVGADAGKADGVRMIGGDWSEFVVGVRQDIQMKVLTEAVIQDNTGAIVFNLAQQDMTAVRLTFRVGWQVSNRINNQQLIEASRYPLGGIFVTGT